MAKGTGKTGTYAFRDGKMVKISDEIPKLGRYQIAGSKPFCETGGETLDFGDGPHHVRDATEKREYMNMHGVMEAQEGIKRPEYDPKSVESFESYFHRTTGTGLRENADGLVKKVGD